MATAKKKVTVRMLCVYSGDGFAVAPGETVGVDAAEAQRLIRLGVARPVEAEGN